MLAVTLYPEWVPAFPILGKDVENRNWWQQRLAGQLVALHAGQAWAGRHGRAARWRGVRNVATFARSRGVPDERVDAYVHAASGLSEAWPGDPRGTIQVVVRVRGVHVGLDVPPALERWSMWESTHHWHTPEVYRLPEPVVVPPGGMHAGLWTLPPASDEQVREQLRALGVSDV